MSDLTELDRVPDACTLPTEELPLRRAEFDDVFATAVAVERPAATHVRFLLNGPASLAGQVADLAARENECCAFFAFTIKPVAPGQVVFEVQVPTVHAAVLDGLVARASKARAAE